MPGSIREEAGGCRSAARKTLPKQLWKCFGFPGSTPCPQRGANGARALGRYAIESGEPGEEHSGENGPGLREYKYAGSAAAFPDAAIAAIWFARGPREHACR